MKIEPSRTLNTGVRVLQAAGMAAVEGIHNE